MAETSTTQDTVESPDRPESEPKIEIDVRFAADRWRYVCPRGHIDWRPTAVGFECHACEEFCGESEFVALIDRRSGERLERRRIRIRHSGTDGEVTQGDE